MGFKQELEKLKEGLLGAGFSRKKLEDSLVETLDTKVDNFIAWYYENMIKGYYSDSAEYKKPKELKNLIEKVAVWYELRYPKSLVHQLIPSSGTEEKDISACMFQKNSYVNEQLDENSEVRILDWEKFYNFDAFLETLPSEEKRFLQRVRYEGLVYLNPSATCAHLHLDQDGYVKMAVGVSACLHYKISDEQMKGLHVKRIVGMLKQEGFPLYPDNELEKNIRNVEKWQNIRNGLLDCAMYRIIERGGNRIGPRRGLLFAKEFERDIAIPMMYGVDTSDPGLRLFVNEYLKAGGKADLVCYKDYFSRTDEHPTLDTISITEILDHTAYTEEEKNLHKRLADILSSQVNPEEEKREKVKQLRIERKLEKSRKSKTDN